MSRHSFSTVHLRDFLLISLSAFLLLPARTLTQPRPLTQDDLVVAGNSVPDGHFRPENVFADGFPISTPSTVSKPSKSAPTSLATVPPAAPLQPRVSNPSKRLTGPLTYQPDVPTTPSQRPATAGKTIEDFSVWLAEMDINHDGQISLYEWRTAGRPVSQFQQMDRNQDGFLTAPEVRYFAAMPARQPLPPAILGNRVDAVSDAEVPKEQVGDSASGSIRGFAGGSMTIPPSAAVRSPKTASATPLPSATPRMSQIKAAHATGASVQVSRPPSRPASPGTAPATTLYPDSLATVALPINNGSNATWTKREQENEWELVMGGHPSVLFLGDSITDWFASGAGKPVWDAYLAPLHADDFAIAGLTTSQVLWQVETGQVSMAAPEVVVLMIGTNNLGLGQNPPAVADGITKIVQEMRAKSPKTKIMLLGILPRGQSPTDPLRAKIAQVNTSISQLADGKQVTYLDIGSRFLQADGTISPTVMADYLHPSLWGYEIYTASIWAPLLELLGK